MIEVATSDVVHPVLSFWLDVVDKIIKFAAVFLGGIWTYWNYRKSRTYAQKLETELSGNVFFKDGVYVDISTSLTNRGASKFILQQEGTSCTLSTIRKDLSEIPIRIFRIFIQHDQMEPGDHIHDALYWRIDLPPQEIVWLKIDLRIVSGKVEWNSVALIRVGEKDTDQHTDLSERGREDAIQSQNN